MTYLLPDAALPTFSRLFRDLDKDKDRLGVTSYGINATTMEEVSVLVFVLVCMCVSLCVCDNKPNLHFQLCLSFIVFLVKKHHVF